MSDGLIVLAILGGTIGIASYGTFFVSFGIEDRVELLLIFLFPIGLALIGLRRVWRSLEWR